MRRASVAAALFVLVIAVVGCSAHRYTNIQTGLFDNDFQKMMAAYDKVQPNITKLSDFKDLGFDFNKPNIQRISGHKALREMLGNDFFQSGFLSERKIEEITLLMNDYKMVVVPYQDLVEVRDYIYFSRRREELSGDDLKLTFVFKNDVIVYAARDYREVLEKRSDNAFMQGVFPWLKIGKDVKGFVN